MGFLLVFVFLGSMTMAQAPKKKPVSVSYEAVVRCFPQLADDRLTFKVDLRVLREKIDNEFTTGSTRVLTRLVQFREGTGVLRRVSLEAIGKNTGVKQEFSPLWETVKDSAEVEPWSEPPVTKPTVTMSEINAVVGRGVIERDETLHLDTKLNGFLLTLRRDLNKFLELRLEEPSKATLRCEDRKDFGPACTCAKK